MPWPHLQGAVPVVGGHCVEACCGSDQVIHLGDVLENKGYEAIRDASWSSQPAGVVQRFSLPIGFEVVRGRECHSPGPGRVDGGVGGGGSR